MYRKVIHRSHSNNCLIEIIDMGDERSLFLGGDVLHSTMSLAAPHALALSYTRYMMSPLLLNDTLQHVLIVGVGAGSLVRFMHHHFPQCVIDAIDNSADILNLARGYFHLPERRVVKIHCQDGYDYLAGKAEMDQYDLILLDAFDESGMSMSVYRPEYFRLCYNHLQDSGILSVNLWSGDKGRMTTLQENIARCFDSAITIPVPNRGNVIALARKKDDIHELMDQSHAKQDQLSKRFAIDFRAISRACLKNNLGFIQRVSRIFY